MSVLPASTQPPGGCLRGRAVSSAARRHVRCSTMRTTPTWSTRTRGMNCGRSRVSRGAGTEESVGLWMTRWEGTPWAVAVCGTCIRQWQVPHRSWRQCCRFALTQVDALDMLAIVGDYKEFAAAVNRVQQHVKFDRNVTVSVYVGVRVCLCLCVCNGCRCFAQLMPWPRRQVRNDDSGARIAVVRPSHRRRPRPQHHAGVPRRPPRHGR